mmetsp:Transcript_47208/g.143512  ORF Transcript_47208/g.143512 Transcript_47208/m.143512 type:complete len:222 (+) Transcript_47208:1166-1831(+)
MRTSTRGTCGPRCRRSARRRWRRSRRRPTSRRRGSPQCIRRPATSSWASGPLSLASEGFTSLARWPCSSGSSSTSAWAGRHWSGRPTAEASSRSQRRGSCASFGCGSPAGQNSTTSCCTPSCRRRSCGSRTLRAPPSGGACPCSTRCFTGRRARERRWSRSASRSTQASSTRSCPAATSPRWRSRPSPSCTSCSRGCTEVAGECCSLSTRPTPFWPRARVA